MRVLFSFVGGEGHLQPLLPIARAAAARGHAVTVTGAASVGRAAAGLPFVASGPDVVAHYVPLQPIDVARERRALRESFAGWMARARADDVLALCERERPDVLIRDEADFGAAVAAERLGIPHASVLVVAAGGLIDAADVAEPLDALRAEHGLAPDPALARLPGLVLSPFPPALRDDLPLGAHAFRAADPMPPEGDGSLVYVTLGTIVNTESGDLFPRLLAGVRDLPLDVLVTVGRAIDPATLGPQPANVRVERYVPQAEVLPRCAVAVVHAGSGSVVGALTHGVPLVCVPIAADQPLNAARCEAVGAGQTLDALTVTPRDVRAAVERALQDPHMRAAARRLRAAIATLPPPTHTVTLLERLARG